MTRAAEILALTEGKKPRWGLEKKKAARADRKEQRSIARDDAASARDLKMWMQKQRAARGKLGHIQGEPGSPALGVPRHGLPSKYSKSPDVTGGVKPHLRGIGHDLRKSDVEGDDELRAAQRAFDKKHPFWDKNKRR